MATSILPPVPTLFSLICLLNLFKPNVWSNLLRKDSGFLFEIRTISKEDVEEAILAANADPSIHGIIVYYPIFPSPSRQDYYIQQLVSPAKDVEGLSHTYVFNMYQNIRFLDPL